MAREINGRIAADSWLRRRPMAVDVAIATIVALIGLPTSVSLSWNSDWELQWRLALIVLIVLIHSCVALRRIRMKAAFAIVSLAMLVLVIAPALGGEAAIQMGSEFAPILLPCSIAFPVILYSVAMYGRGRETRIALLVAIVGSTITAVRLWEPGNLTTGVPTGNAWRLFISGAMLASVIAPWALGRFRSIHEAYVGALEEQSLRAEQDRVHETERATALERSRIAREMHDVVAHSLSVMVSQSEGGRLAVERDPSIAGPVFSTIATTGRSALTEMRGLLGVLGSADLSGRAESQWARSPQPALSDLEALVNRVSAAGTSIEMTERGSRTDLGRTSELAAYRVVQEALTNVVKHAGPGASVDITLIWSSAGLTIDVCDDGRATNPADNGGRGLAGMRERVELIGGQLKVGVHEVGGYRVHARIPSSVTTTGEAQQ